MKLKIIFITILLILIYTIIRIVLPTNPFSNPSLMSAIAPFSIPSNVFNNGQITFTITKWPQFGTFFKPIKRILHPYGYFEAEYSSRGAQWTVGTEIGNVDGEQTYYISATKGPLIQPKITGNDMMKLLKASLKKLQIDVGKSKLAAPAYFCLTGKNTTRKSITIQNIFQHLKRRTCTINI